ncbi:McrB family protein [Vibrio parahaemolyticus]|uniref:McrB family protein n=1 Tax=Vibrio parahaemolyticus TaxID=670 RepID=UPI002151AAC1|nr:AAA family ATPase [Vibrio parahaemolyticus]
MITIEQIKELLGTELRAFGKFQSDVITLQNAQYLHAVLRKETAYPSWDTKFDIKATIESAVLTRINHKEFAHYFTEKLIEQTRKAMSPVKVAWFVGASYDNGSDDQTERFLQEGIWESGYDDKYIEDVRSMKPGDRIAIKSAYTRKKNLPFENRKQFVSVMAIKVTGTVKYNHGDGKRVDVEWESTNASLREWYFYTSRSTVWRVSPEDWMTKGLIDFAFNGAPQDYQRFCNAPYWKERYGDKPNEQQRFKWTLFYQEFADKLLAYRDNRPALLEIIHQLPSIVEGISPLFDQMVKSKREPLNDICPFTVMGLFNRGIKDKNRIGIAQELANFLQVEEPVPSSFEGIPILNNQKSWFFSYGYSRKESDIDNLWILFESALVHANEPDTDTGEQLANAYEVATQIHGTGWNLSMGLYWIRPWKYLTLDSQSRTYLIQRLGLPVGLNGHKNRCSGVDYLGLIDDLEARFQEENYPVHSFPELSLSAWAFNDDEMFAHPNATDDDGSEDDELPEDDSAAQTASLPPYGIDDIIGEGCFLEREAIEKVLSHLRHKKNLILQGPPGTGKTWLAKRLAYALMGQKNDKALRAVQFHPNLSYEDFVRGWRPSGDGKLSLVDGPFMEMIEKAKTAVGTRHVVVIEEINRGNPAQIFGEMLTLLEHDKRTPSEGLELSYRKKPDERVHIPANLYVIGTMNIADRSLALVDLALRRRFAFIDLKPSFGKAWRDWVHIKSGIDMETLTTIELRLQALNNEIARDRNLGPQFEIGHSYFTLESPLDIENPTEWFQGVIDAQIGPLLDEYWFDDLDRAQKAREALLEDI